MKNSILTGLLLISLSSFGQMREEIITKEYTFENPTTTNVFQLANINGSIKVEVHDKGSYILTGEKKIYGKTDERIAKGLKEVSLSLLDRYDTLIAYISSPCHSFQKKEKRSSQNYGYSYNSCELSYDYKVDFTLKVPKNANLVLSTINQGDIAVIGIAGNLDIHNVNGAISIDNAEGKVVVHTINGDIYVNYASNPIIDSKYYTLNGDIHANFKVGLSAKIAFKSYNGEMYTNLPALKTIAGEFSRAVMQESDGLKYKIDDRQLVQVRKGTMLLDFETFNGDAIIREK